VVQDFRGRKERRQNRHSYQLGIIHAEHQQYHNQRDFAQKIVANSCGATVAAGASCLIKVTFTPTQVGVRNGTLSVFDNAPGSPQTVSLSGTGK